MNLTSRKHSKSCTRAGTRERRNEKGFTLVEVLIALFILALIGATTAKAVVDAAKLREVLRDETEYASEFRTSVAFIERDLDQVFNPRWFLAADFKPLDPYNANNGTVVTTLSATPAVKALSIDEISRRTRGTAFQPTDFWGPVLDPTGIRASRFKGKADSLSFVSASHMRIYQQKRESIYAKVRYELIPQPPNPNLSDDQNAKLSGLHALIKIEDPRAFNFEDRKDAPWLNTYVILNNIKSLKFSYYKLGDKDSKHEWDSEATETKSIFPVAVQMDVTISGPKERSIDEKILFYLETPNDMLPKTY